MTGPKAAFKEADKSMSNSEASDWHQWCRLCAKDHSENLNVYFKDGDQTWTSVLAVAIGKYFWVNIKMDDELSNSLCKQCYTLVEDLIEFSDRVNRVQSLFTKLQNAGSHTVLNYKELRKDFGLPSINEKHSSVSVPVKSLVEKVEGDALDYVGDEMVESYDDEDTEIMTEIDAAELIDNQSEESDNRDDFAEESYVEDEESTVVICPEPEATSDDIQFPLKEKINDESADTGGTITTLKDNENVNNAHAQFKCMACMKVYKKPMTYKRHMAEVHCVISTDMENFECKRCNKIFTTENEFAVHYRSHIPAKDKAENACIYCPKFFTTSGALKRHILCIHENIKPFICDCCGKGMKTITALNEHKLVHTDECPFECTICHRRFKNKARLKVHLDTHTNKSYECNICGLKLNTRRTLNMHQLVHIDAKQFKCDVCGAAFKRGKTLKAHLILHTGIRPYKCNFCGKDFSNGSNCRMHKRKTHPKELADEEERGVMRSTLLPMITELTEASKRVKKPAKPGTAIVRSKLKNDPSESAIANSANEFYEEADDEMLYEIVEESS